MKTPHLIGFSLSFCIQQIIEGKVKLEDVLYIQTGCAPKNQDDINDILDNYSKSYWRHNPTLACDIFWAMYHAHQIGFCANTFDIPKSSCNIAWGYWLSTNNAITLSEQHL
jgi:hypothetical protein